MNKVSILYVEDDFKAREHYIKGLKHIFETIYEAQNIQEARDIYSDKKIDILLVDVNLPDGNGLDFIREIRKLNNEISIIVLSAYSEKELLLSAMNLGLISYLIKPVSAQEMMKVLDAALHEKYSKDRIELSENLYWYKKEFKVEHDNKYIYLTLHENRLLELLSSNRNRVFTFEEIEAYIWENNLSSYQALKSLLTRLKRKIPLEFIKNHYSIGYQMVIQR